jgi:hypothetical protein
MCFKYKQIQLQLLLIAVNGRERARLALRSLRAASARRSQFARPCSRSHPWRLAREGSAAKCTFSKHRWATPLRQAALLQTCRRNAPSTLTRHSAVVRWLVFPPVTRKTRVQPPIAELCSVGGLTVQKPPQQM